MNDEILTNELFSQTPISQRSPYVIYIKLDDENRITAVNSSAFLLDVTEWTEIDSGYGDKYHHAQGNYFPMPIMDMRGICRYKLEDGKPVERTQEEMDADYVEPEIQLTSEDRIAALEKENAELKERNNFIEDCIAEMAMLLYS